MDYSFEEVAKKIQNLPDDLQDIIMSPDIFEKIQKIGISKLPKEKVSQFEKQTAYVLIGLVHPNSFTTVLRDTLHITQDEARAVASIVEVEIFNPIRETLGALHDTTTNNREETPEVTLKTAAPAITTPQVEFPEKKDLIQTIENPNIIHTSAAKIEPTLKVPLPPKPISDGGILAQKLNSFTSVPKQEKTSTPTNPPQINRGPDPYRESV
jgi:hypothetical protein